MSKFRAGRVAALVGALGVTTLALTGCFGGTAPVPSYTITYSPPPAKTVAPLLGTYVDAAKVAGPALVVKVCNHFDCEPEIGLNHADIVFEELVEGGITRYVAIWQSDVPETVGPVRSVRPMDGDIAASFGGILAYSGWGPEEVHQLALESGLINVTENDTNMYRLDDRVSPYNLALHAQNVIAENPGVPPPKQQFLYSAGVSTSSAALDGTPGSQVDEVFSGNANSSWTYNPASQKYLRSQWGGPDLDEAGTQLSATNVIVMYVEVTQFFGLPRTMIVGSGEAFINTGGKVIHGTWNKGSGVEPLRFTDDNGIPIRLAPGNTWIEMPPVDGGQITITP